MYDMPDSTLSSPLLHPGGMSSPKQVFTAMASSHCLLSAASFSADIAGTAKYNDNNLMVNSNASGVDLGKSHVYGNSHVYWHDRVLARSRAGNTPAVRPDRCCVNLQGTSTMLV